MEDNCGCGHTHECNSEEEMEEVEVCVKCGKSDDECECPCDKCGKSAEECTCPCEKCGKVEEMYEKYENRKKKASHSTWCTVRK